MADHSVAADLAGAATLAALVDQDFTNQPGTPDSLLGNVFLGAPQEIGWYAGSSLSGEATLTATPLGMVPVEAALSGAAALAADVTGAVPLVAAIQGSAALAADLTGVVPAAAGLSASATLDATLTRTIFLLESVGVSEGLGVVQVHKAASGLVGSADIQASADNTINAEAALAGEAIFLAVPDHQIVAEPMVGSAHLMADAMNVIYVEAALAGEADLQPTPTAQVHVLAALAGEAGMLATVGVVRGPMAWLSGHAALRAALSQARPGVEDDATIVPTTPRQEFAYQTRHYSIQARRR